MALKCLTVAYGFRYVTSDDSMTISFGLRLHGWSQFCCVDVLRLYVPVRIWVIPASNALHALHATRILWTSSGYVLRFSHSRHNLNILMIFSWYSPVANHGDVTEIVTPPDCFQQDVKLQELEDLVEDLRLQRRHRVRRVDEGGFSSGGQLGSLVYRTLP